MNRDLTREACEHYGLEIGHVIIMFFDVINYYYERREPLPVWIGNGRNWKTIPNLYFMVHDGGHSLEKPMIDQEERRINDPFGNALDFLHCVAVKNGKDRRGELMDWLAKHTNDVWIRNGNLLDKDLYYFAHESDAIFFRLTWG